MLANDRMREEFAIRNEVKICYCLNDRQMFVKNQNRMMNQNVL